MATTIVIGVNIGIMEKKMETTRGFKVQSFISEAGRVGFSCV